MTLDQWVALDKARTDEWIAGQVGLERSSVTHIRRRNRGASLAKALALSRLTGGKVPVEEFLAPASEAAE